MSDLATLAGSGYQLLLADPPWQTVTYDRASAVPTQAADPYPTMHIEDLATMPVEKIVAPHALLAMWVIGTHIPQAFWLAQEWGFDRFATDLFYWTKQKLVRANQIDIFTGDIAEPKIGMGKHSRKQVEPCLLFARGKGLPVHAHDVRQLIIAPSLGHSRKPAEQYERLEQLYGDVKRIELFARNTRPGWDSWGNEVGKFDEVAA